MTPVALNPHKNNRVYEPATRAPAPASDSKVLLIARRRVSGSFKREKTQCFMSQGLSMLIPPIHHDYNYRQENPECRCSHIHFSLPLKVS